MNFDLLLSNLDLRANRASDALLSQVHDDHPATVSEMERVHDRLLGAWRELRSNSNIFSLEQQEKIAKRAERVNFLAQSLRKLCRPE